MEAIFFAIYYKCDQAFYDQIRYLPHNLEAWTLVAECAAANLRTEYLIAIMLRCPSVGCMLPAPLCKKVDPVLRYAADIFNGTPAECVERALGFACKFEYVGLIRETLAMGADASRFVGLCATHKKFNSLRAIATYGAIAMPADKAGDLYDGLLRSGIFQSARLIARIFHIPEDPIAQAHCSAQGDTISQLSIYHAFAAYPAIISDKWWFRMYAPRIAFMAHAMHDNATLHRLQELSA